MNNFKAGYTEVYNYYNFSDRVDYNINDQWKVYGRIGRYYTDDLAPNATPNQSKLYRAHGNLPRRDPDLRRLQSGPQAREPWSTSTATGTR